MEPKDRKNLVRLVKARVDSLSPYEMALLAKKLIEKQKVSIEEIASKLNRPVSYIKDLLSNLDALHPAIRKAWTDKTDN